MGPTELPLGPKPPVESSPGYIPTALGAALGGGVGAIAGGALGGAYANRFMPDAGLEAIGPIAIAALVSLWLSACFGAWVGLRLTRSEAVGPTVFMTAAGIPAWAIVSLPSLFWMSGELGPQLSPPVEMGIALLILCIPPALAARALILHQKKLAEREEI